MTHPGVHPAIPKQELARSPYPWEVQVLDGLPEAWLKKLVEFLQRVAPGGVESPWSREYFRWKLGESNPAGRGFLTCAVASGEVVGVTSLTPKRIWFRNQSVTGAEIGDLYTHPALLRVSAHRASRAGDRSGFSREFRKSEYLRRSVLGRLASESIHRASARGITLLYGTPNKLARPGLQKQLGFLAHPAHRNHRFVRPTAWGLVSRCRGLRPARGLLLGCEAMLERLLRALTVLRAGRRYRLDRLDQPSDRLNELWDRLKGQREFSLVRDQQYFQHRFFAHPVATYRIHTASDQGRLLGVMVTRIVKTLAGREYACIADWLVDASQPQIFPWLLTHAIHECDWKRLDGFQLWCGFPGGYTPMLRRLGFVRMSESPIVFLQNAQGNAALHTCPTLDFTLASSDNI